MDENIENNKNIQNAKRKKSDLNKLNQMYKIINKLKYDSIDSNLIQILLDIADLAGGENGISYNQVDLNCVRNKYGYIIRAKSKKGINKTGIYFEKLYHLKVILNESSFLSDTEKQELTNNLYSLQKKILNILKQENEFEDDLLNEIPESSFNPEDYMNDIRKFSTQRYEKIALKKIKDEIISFEIDDDSMSTILDDILSYDGEDIFRFLLPFFFSCDLSRELIKYVARIINENLLNVLKNIRDIRNFFIHRRYEAQNYNKIEIEEIILQLKENLSIIIKTNGQSIILNYDSDKDDIYYFSRKFSIIGELSQEKIKDVDKTVHENLLNVFKNILDIRNFIIHDRYEAQNWNKMEIEEIILQFKENLSIIIKTNGQSIILNYHSDKDDIYYFSRKFIIIGELSQEIIEDVDKTVHENLLNVLKNFRDIRNFFIHRHIEAENWNKMEIEKIILQLKENLSIIIKTNGQSIILNYDSEIIELLINNSKKLHTIINNINSKTANVGNKNSVKTDVAANSAISTTKLLNNLKSKIILASKTIKDFEESLEKLNNEYQNEKDKTTNVEVYPEELSIETHQNIIELANKFDKSRKDKLKENKNQRKMKSKLTTSIPSNPSNLLNKFEILIINAANVFDKFEESLAKMNLEYQDIKEKLIEEFESYPECLSINNKDLIINLGNKLKKESEQNKILAIKQMNDENRDKELKRTRSRITEINKNIAAEIKYLEKLEKRENINEKQKYIMEQIVSIIGQYRRDLDDACSTLIKFDADDFISPLPSNLSHDASASAKYARSNELAHDIFSLNRNLLNQRITDEILPAKFDFSFISQIYEYEYHNKNIPKSLQEYISLGLNYVYFEMVNESIKYFELAIKRIKEVNTIDFSKIEQLLIISEHEISFKSCLSKSWLCFDLTHTYLILILTLACQYCYISKYDKMYELLEPIYSKIESIKNIEINYLNFHSYIRTTYALFTTCLYHRQDKNYEAVLNKVEKFSALTDDDTLGKLALFPIYMNLNKYKEADELCESLLKDTKDSGMRFPALLLKSFMLERNKSNEDQFKLINKTNQILSQMNELKLNKKGDIYIEQELAIIDLELFLIHINLELIRTNKISLDLNLKLKLIESEEKFVKFVKLINNLKIVNGIINLTLSKLYNNFTSLFCKILTVKVNSESEYEEMFNKALEYFNKLSNLDKSEHVLDFGMACYYFVIEHELVTESEKRIKYLKQTVEIMKPYIDQVKLWVPHLLIELGYEYHKLGLKCISYGNQLKNDAVENFRQSIDYLKQIDFEIEVYKVLKKGIYYVFITNYKEVAKIRPDLESIEEAIFYAENLVKIINSEIEYINTSEETNNNELIRELELEYEKRMKEVFIQKAIRYRTKIIQILLYRFIYFLRRFYCNLYQALKIFCKYSRRIEKFSMD